MLADGAHGGSHGASDNLAAVEAHPLDLNIGHKQLVLLQQLSKLAEAVAMGLFNSGNHGKMWAISGNPPPGRSWKARVVVVPLLVLIVLGRAKVVQNVGKQLYGVGAVHLKVLTGHLLQQVVEHLGVGPFLVRGEGEHALQYIQVLPPGQSGCEGVAVAGLTLAGKGRMRLSLVSLCAKSADIKIPPVLWIP